jgi:hypothetical protein
MSDLIVDYGLFATSALSQIIGLDYVSAGVLTQGAAGAHVSGADDAAISGVESVSPLVSVASADGLDLAVVESVALMARVLRADALAVASQDSVAAIHSALDRADTLGIGAAGEAIPQVSTAASDTVALGNDDAAVQIASVIDRADQAALAAGESTAGISARLARADAIRVAADELVSALYGEIQSMAALGVGVPGSAATAIGVIATDTAAVAAADAAGMIAVVVEHADQATLAADDQAGPVLARLTREDLLALHSPGVAEILTALQRGDAVSVSLSAAAQIIAEVTQVAGSDTLAPGANDAAHIQQTARGLDALRTQILSETAVVFAEVAAADSAGLSLIEGRDIAVALAALDRMGVAIDEQTTVLTVIVQVGDGLTLRLAERSLRSAIDNETGRLVGAISLRALLDSEVSISPELAARLKINPDEVS